MATDEVTCLKHNETYPDGPGYCWQCDREAQEEYEQAIRADERAKIVAMLEAMAKEKFTEPASNDLLRAAKRVLSGEHRPKPGQPKEGGQ